MLLRTSCTWTVKAVALEEREKNSDRYIEKICIENGITLRAMDGSASMIFVTDAG